MTIAESLLLGSLQGLTEFLPISSSGHLILARELLGVNTEGGLAFDAILQLGTILAVVIYFRNDLLRLARSVLPLGWQVAGSDPKADRRMVLAIAIATVPGVALGKLLERTMETTFRHDWLVAAMLLLGSLVFLFSERYGKEAEQALSLPRAAVIGLFQCLALVPGMSRSGMTISGGLLAGLNIVAATRFSFLLSVPIIAGSGLFKLAKVAVGTQATVDYGVTHIAIGFSMSFLVGYASIAWLLRIIRTSGLSPFIGYRLVLANAVFLLYLYRGPT
jgi:undecaprenyl-diphosphatase